MKTEEDSADSVAASRGVAPPRTWSSGALGGSRAPLRVLWRACCCAATCAQAACAAAFARPWCGAHCAVGQLHHHCRLAPRKLQSPQHPRVTGMWVGCTLYARRRPSCGTPKSRWCPSVRASSSRCAYPSTFPTQGCFHSRCPHLFPYRCHVCPNDRPPPGPATGPRSRTSDCEHARVRVPQHGTWDCAPTHLEPQNEFDHAHVQETWSPPLQLPESVNAKRSTALWRVCTQSFHSGLVVTHDRRLS